MTLAEERTFHGRTRAWSSAAPFDWRRRLVTILLGLDLVAAAVGNLVAGLIRFGDTSARLAGAPIDISYVAVALAAIPLWLVILALGGTYDERRVGNGAEEYRAVITGAVRLLAVIAIFAYLGSLNVSRTYVGAAVPITLVLSLLLRHAARKWVLRRRMAGEYGDDLLVVGTPESVTNLVRHFRRSPGAGYFIQGAIVEGGLLALDVDGEPVPIYGEPHDVLQVLRNTEADAVAVADPTTLGDGQLRRLAWELEGSGMDLLVAPAITDFAGPRIDVRPAAGLPLLHVEEPQLEGAARLVKNLFDRSIALALLVLTAPLFVLIALVIRLDSPGPVFFRQRRVGQGGSEFVCWKFRTMRVGADDEKTQLEHLNEHDGVLFKIREDPRRTKIGRLLRRTSIDELPQLLNILTGQMSIVGPRPPVPKEVANYADDARRRLLVKPGLTGLWQVSGRADLAWEESVRLDLYYVENWSIALDMMILWRTAAAVITGRGAY